MAELETSTNVDNQESANVASVGDDAQTTTEQVSTNVEVNQRLLKESRKNKALRIELQKENDGLKKAELANQGKWRERAEQAEQKNAELVNAVITEKKHAKLRDVAAKAGCIDLDVAVKLFDDDLLVCDPDDLSVSGVDEAVSALKSKYDFLFKSKTAPTLNASVPGGSVVKTGNLTLDGFKSLPQSEQNAYVVERMKQKK